MFSFALFNPSSFLLALSAVMGVLLHDTLLDRATPQVLGLPVIIASSSEGNTNSRLDTAFHTEAEANSFVTALQQASSHGPEMQPRTEDRKHLAAARLFHMNSLMDEYQYPLA